METWPLRERRELLVRTVVRWLLYLPNCLILWFIEDVRSEDSLSYFFTKSLKIKTRRLSAIGLRNDLSAKWTCRCCNRLPSLTRLFQWSLEHDRYGLNYETMPNFNRVKSPCLFHFSDNSKKLLKHIVPRWKYNSSGCNFSFFMNWSDILILKKCWNKADLHFCALKWQCIVHFYSWSQWKSRI